MSTEKYEDSLDRTWSIPNILKIALSCRLLLVFYSTVHDYVFKVKFTDIDYQVYTDAAINVYNGRSPYERHTYRYTPVLAWVLVPNVAYEKFGKILFCLVDILVGWLLFKIALTRLPLNVTIKKKFELLSECKWAVALFWLFNPLTVVISARGNADCIVCAAVILTIYLLRKNQWLLAAIVHGGLAVHFKIYPIIYLPSIYLALSQVRLATNFQEFLRYLFLNFRGYIFVIISISCFVFLLAIGYHFYGYTFLNEYLLYHFTRQDIRHNFSPYFYPLYLSMNDPFWTKVLSLGAFLPQMISTLVFAFKYYDDLPFCWFLSTLAFVSLNKVCTSQYFVWYIVFLPLVSQNLEISNSQTFRLLFLWFGGQGAWLLPAYFLEFQGWNTYIWIWLSSLLFLCINFYIMVSLIRCYKPLVDNVKAKKL
uniref:GPI alpha-1,4-mannosyltransferase I, catalytic subunit n=1 Tax=Acrobeloides nanus TaxID=290746 RepID=A0A914CC16_9BILA